MNDRIFTLVNALLNRGYILRVVHAGSFESGLQWEDYEGCYSLDGLEAGDAIDLEGRVNDCFHRILGASLPTPEIIVFSPDEWAETDGHATAHLEIDRDGDTVSYHREHAPDSFITNRVQETR